MQLRLPPPANNNLDREEALKDDFPLDGSAYGDDEEEDDEWAGDDNQWNDEGEPEEEEHDAKDESTAYLEFLNEEAQKFQNLDMDDSDDELGEETLLETPLDKLEPYQLFRDGLLSMFTSINFRNSTNKFQNSNTNNPTFTSHS